ncbi:MAG TPA: hypothetical protein EYP40_05105 [Chromatiales bacterium]|nr:hypothetical protein [Chromatiales bacterium]
MRKAAKLAIGVALVLGAVSLGAPAEARELIQNKGSDTLVNVAQAWAEAYQTVNSEVAVAVTGGGSGLGLSIVKAIIEAHGGKVGFTSFQNVGTTIYFDLPLAPTAGQAGARA